MSNTEVIKKRHIILKDIERKYGQPVENEEAARVMRQISSGTVLRGSYIGTPPEESTDFELMSFQSMHTEDLKRVVKKVFEGKPEALYLLSEEKSISQIGLTKLPFDAALNKVLPYIREWGQNTNYWITDGRRTVTFHRAGIAYWKKMVAQSAPRLN